MPKKIRNIFQLVKTKFRYWIPVVCLFILVGLVLYFFKPHQVELSVFRQSSVVENSETNFSSNLSSNSVFTFLDEPRLSYTFKYPKDWKVVVSLSKDRDNFLDNVQITSPGGDFYISLTSYLRPQLSLPNSDLSFNLNEFETLDVQDKKLCISLTGASELESNPETKELMLVASSIVPNLKEPVFELNNGKLTDQLTILDKGSSNTPAYGLQVQYSAATLLPALSWVTYRQSLTEIVKSISPKSL